LDYCFPFGAAPQLSGLLEYLIRIKSVRYAAYRDWLPPIQESEAWWALLFGSAFDLPFLPNGGIKVKQAAE
jgi:hypothetical protein